MKDHARYYRGSVDSHAHLALLERKGLDARRVLEEAAAGGLGRIVDVGVSPGDLAERIERFAGDSLVAFTAGLHPTAVDPSTVEAELCALERLLAERHADPQPGRIVAIGELGLDFYWSDEHRELQEEALVRQWELARRHSLPVIVHNRDSEEAMLAALRRHAPTGVMHCFSQDAAYCRACLDLGLFVSFSGNLTYKRSGPIREAAALVPDDRLLVETDSPYLSPQVVRGTANHPGHLGFVVEELARVRGTSPERIAELTAQNAVRLFVL